MLGIPHVLNQEYINTDSVLLKIAVSNCIFDIVHSIFTTYMYMGLFVIRKITVFTSYVEFFLFVHFFTPFKDMHVHFCPSPQTCHFYM